MTALIIIAIIILWIGSATVRTINDRRARRQFRENNTRWEQQYAWNAKQEKINRKQAEEVLKLNKRVSTLEMKVEQAEYDIEIEKENLDRFSAKLSRLDEDLKHAEWEIDSWAKQRHLANVAKAEAKRDKIKDSIYAWEDKVRKAEKRLAKAERTKTIAENELREVA